MKTAELESHQDGSEDMHMSTMSPGFQKTVFSQSFDTSILFYHQNVWENPRQLFYPEGAQFFHPKFVLLEEIVSL